MHSCFYEGRVRHARRAGTPHRFERRLYLAYLDLDETPELVARGWLGERGLGQVFAREDHFGPREQPLAETVRDEVAQAAGRRPAGPVRVLTLLRQFGYYFNPLSLYFCFDADGAVEAIVAEVSNTPWRERHVYVLGDHNRLLGDSRLAFAHPKAFHVSPFLDQRMIYRWQCTAPEQRLGVRIAARAGERTLFSASLSLARVAWTPANSRRLEWTYPAMTWQVTAAIYYEAFWLWWKGNAYVPHPVHDPADHAAHLARTAPRDSGPSLDDTVESLPLRPLTAN